LREVPVTHEADLVIILVLITPHTRSPAAAGGSTILSWTRTSEALGKRCCHQSGMERTA